MQKRIVLPFAPVLVESTRSIGYSFESALADIIDNSVGKNAKEVYVYSDSNCPQYVVIIDNGIGMSSEELESAMRYGSKSSLDKRDEKDLGRFGLGLKMASLSQCRKLTVVTKKESEIFAARWDIDCIKEDGNWVLLWLEPSEIDQLKYIEKLKNFKSGTLVLWEEFDRLAKDTSVTSVNAELFDEKIDEAHDHVALVFHRYIGDENPARRINIFFNNNKVDPIDPFLTTNPGTQPLEERSLYIGNQKIIVKPYILPYYSKLSSKDKRQIGDNNDIRRFQGFYVYRNRRLIIRGTWFKLIKQYELSKLARVRVDIPNTLDDIWEIDIKKSAASLPNSIKQDLKEIVFQAIGRSKRVFTYRGRKVKDDKIEHTWNIINNRGAIQYLVNRDIPLYRQIEDSLDETGQRNLDSFIKMLEDSFPFQDVYNRIAQNPEDIKKGALEFEEAYRIGSDIVESLKQIGGDIDAFLKSLDSFDFFINYPNVVKKLREDYSK